MATLEESRLVQSMVTLPRNRTERQQSDGAADVGGNVSMEPIDPAGLVDNMKHLLPLISVSDSDNYSTSKRVRHLNDLAKVIKHVGHVVEPSYPVERIIECARLALSSSVKEVRAGALRVLRYVLTSKDIFSVMLKHRVDLLVARSLDVSSAREIERIQAMRFVRQAVTIGSQQFPRSLIAPLVSILLHESEPPENLTWSCMATLSELALLNPELSAQTWAIKAIIRGLLKCSHCRISESVVLTLCHLLNTPYSRRYIRSQLDVESLLAPITDLHYRHLVEDLDRTFMREDNKLRIEASKMAIVALLKSWPGVYCLCRPNNNGLGSLLEMLPLTKPQVQREILDLLYSVFQLKVPEWTESFTDAVISIDPSQPKSEWSLGEGFVVEEANDLLPPKNMDRTNLVDCYHALLLATLMEEGLFDYLVETVLRAERHVTVMATILLAQLLHMTNTILPPGYFNDAHVLPELIASAMAFGTGEQQDERIRASEVISCLDRVHQLKKQEVKPSSLYLKLILEQSGYFSTKMTADKDIKQHLPLELDEATLNGLIKDTNVLLTKEYGRWNWNLLRSMLQHSGLKSSHLMEDTLFAKFIKRLCNFFKPSNHIYSTITYSEEHSRKYSSVGQLLVKYLCRAEDNPTGYLYELLEDIVVELSQVTASKLTADVFSSSSVSHKLARDYFLFIGTVSFHKQSLLSQCNVYAPLLVICNYHNRSDLMKLMISCLDCAHDVKSRVILSKVLTSADSKMRMYATKHMRVLLRSKMPFFNSWGLEMLIYQLYDVDQQIGLEAVDILDEACQEESFLETLVLQQPHLMHLGEKGAALLTRFFSVKRGYSLMSRLGYIDRAINMWFKEVNSLYVYLVEERLALALTSFIQTEEGEFVRRNNTSLIHPKAFIPVHLFGQLVQHEEGCIRVDREEHVVNITKSLRRDITTSCNANDIHEVKAAVWALGHIGSTVGGLQLLMKENVVEYLVEMAEGCPVLSVRGTCFYALCLISKTIQGANLLLELGWTSVQHSPEEKWPLNVEQSIDIDESAFESPMDDSPTRRFTFAPYIGTTFDLPSPHPHSPASVVSIPAMIAKSDTLPGKVAGSKSFAENLGYNHSPLKEPNQSEHYSHRTDRPSALEKSDSNVSILNSRMSKFRRSISRRGSSRHFYRSVKEHPGRPHYTTPKHTSSMSQTKRYRSSVSAIVSSPEVRAQSFSTFHQHSLSRSFSKGQLRLSTSTNSSSYLGICLPMDMDVMFEYDEPDYEGCPTKLISAPDFEKEVLPHDPMHCMECAIPYMKVHRMGACLSIDSIDERVTRSRSHTSDSISSSTSSTVGMTQSNSHSRTGTEPPTTAPAYSRSPKSPLLTAKFKVGSIKSDETVDVDSESNDKKTKLQHQNGNNREKLESRVEMNGMSSRSHSSSPLVRMKRIYNSNGDDQQRHQNSPEGDGVVDNKKQNETDELAAEEPAVIGAGGYDSSTRSVDRHEEEERDEEERREEEGERVQTEHKEQPSDTLAVQVESPPALDEDGLAHSSSSGEVATTPKTDTSVERLEIKKGGSDVTSSSSSSMSAREGGTSTGGEEASSSTQSSETKDVTAEVLINVVPSSNASRSSHTKPSKSTDAAETTSTSSTATTQSTGGMDENSPEGRRKLHHAVLELVYGLSSDVSVKKNCTGMHMICQKYPSVTQDVCLYSKVMELLATYQYSVPSRRYIQRQFEKMTFSPLFAAKPPLDEDFSEDDLVSSASSSRRGSLTGSTDYLQTSLTSLQSDRSEREATSKAFRRRSSTSDALRFREKLQELSRSADMHDDMMGESPREHMDQDPSSPEVIEPAVNSNSNNNSPVDKVNFKEGGGEGGGGEYSKASTNLFNVRFRSHVRASSDTIVIDYAKAPAISNLTEVYATATNGATVSQRMPQGVKTAEPLEMDVQAVPKSPLSSRDQGKPPEAKEVPTLEVEDEFKIPSSPHRERGTSTISGGSRSPVSPRRKRETKTEGLAGTGSTVPVSRDKERATISPTAGVTEVEIQTVPSGDVEKMASQSQGVDITLNGKSENQVPPAPGVQRMNVLNVPGGTGANKVSLDTDSNDPSRTSAMFDIGYDL